MSFDPKAEPCGLCGNEQDECVCPPDLPEDLFLELNDESFEWNLDIRDPFGIEEEKPHEDGR